MTWNNCWFVVSWPWRIMAVAPWRNVMCPLCVCCLGLHKLSATLLSQLCMNSNDWPCIKIHQSVEHNMQDLESTVDEAGLLILMHVFCCIQLGFKPCVVISKDRVVIIALLFCVPVFLEEGLTELWVQAEGGTSIQYVPFHTQHARLDQNLCNLLPALQSQWMWYHKQDWH